MGLIKIIVLALLVGLGYYYFSTDSGSSEVTTTEQAVEGTTDKVVEEAKEVLGAYAEHGKSAFKSLKGVKSDIANAERIMEENRNQNLE